MPVPRQSDHLACPEKLTLNETVSLAASDNWYGDAFQPRGRRNSGFTSGAGCTAWLGVYSAQETVFAA